MARKRIADKEPAVSTEGAATAPSLAGASAQTPAGNKARAPRASANAVTHRHKKTATAGNEAVIPEAVERSQPVAQAMSVPALAAAPVAAPIAASAVVKPEAVAPPKAVLPPTHEQIQVRAYLIAEARGFQNGSPVEDWITAERELSAGLTD